MGKEKKQKGKTWNNITFHNPGDGAEITISPSDTVWIVEDGRVHEATVAGVLKGGYRQPEGQYDMVLIDETGTDCYVSTKNYNNTFFLSREEAEAAVFE